MIYALIKLFTARMVIKLLELLMRPKNTIRLVLIFCILFAIFNTGELRFFPLMIYFYGMLLLMFAFFLISFIERFVLKEHWH